MDFPIADTTCVQKVSESHLWAIRDLNFRYHLPIRRILEHLITLDFSVEHQDHWSTESNSGSIVDETCAQGPESQR